MIFCSFIITVTFPQPLGVGKPGLQNCPLWGPTTPGYLINSHLVMILSVEIAFLNYL